MSQARTIGGLIMARLPHVPVAGETVSEAGYRFTVEEATDRAIKRLRVERVSKRASSGAVVESHAAGYLQPCAFKNAG